MTCDISCLRKLKTRKHKHAKTRYNNQATSTKIQITNKFQVLIFKNTKGLNV